MKEFGQSLSRREFLHWMGEGMLRVGSVVVTGKIIELIQTPGGVVQIPRGQDKAQSNIEEVVSQLDNTPWDTTGIETLKVQLFSQKIYAAAERINSSSQYEERIAMVLGYFSGDALGGYFLRNQSDFLNKTVGVTGLFAGRVIDLLSTVVFLNYAEDPRFKEYGFNDYFMEQSPIFPTLLPSKDEMIVKGSLITSLLLPIAWWLPFLGRGYFGASPFIAKNNLEVAHQMMTCMILGDQTKMMIEEGQSKEEISSFLLLTKSADALRV